jgi:RNA polymerase sigma-70 factor, ECF subfamily
LIRNNVETGRLKGEVRRAARGDEIAAAAIFDEYHPRVYRYALVRLRDHAAAEDVASETFARVLRRLDRFKWKGAGFEAWLFRIAANLVVDHVRAGQREQPTEEVRVDEPDVATPEAAAMAAESAGELSAMLDELPPDQREVLNLRFAGGLDTNEVAGAMGRNANAIRQLQFRALTNLREKMGSRAEATR